MNVHIFFFINITFFCYAIFGAFDTSIRQLPLAKQAIIIQIFWTDESNRREKCQIKITGHY